MHSQDVRLVRFRTGSRSASPSGFTNTAGWASEIVAAYAGPSAGATVERVRSQTAGASDQVQRHHIANGGRLRGLRPLRATGAYTLRM
jgi:hypothetical protein